MARIIDRQTDRQTDRRFSVWRIQSLI